VKRLLWWYDVYLFLFFSLLCGFSAVWATYLHFYDQGWGETYWMLMAIFATLMGKDVTRKRGWDLP